MTIDQLIAQLRGQIAAKLEQRATHQSAIDRILAACEADSKRDPSEDEATQVTTARAAKETVDTEVGELRAELARVEDEKRRDDAASALAREYAPTQTASGVRVGSEPTSYRKGGRDSYFRDLISVSLQRADASPARERLERNDLEVRALTTTDGAGGDFVPPAWMVDEYVNLARAGRITADRVRQQPLPTGTDSINLPKISTGTATAEQAAQNTALQNTDATTATVTAAVATIAGQQVIAVQLVEQSPINMDEILLGDLAADYATKVDVFVLNNNAANKRGLLNVTGINAVTYTDATPTVAELYPKIADGIQQIDTKRFLPADTIVMHPRRWGWFTAAVDSSGRPFVVPVDQGPFNSAAVAAANASQGYVGTLQGLPVFKDPNIPINLGAGTNEDRIIIMRSNDVILYEGNARAEAFRETKADQLSVLLRFYNYVALHSERFPKAIAVISGTGLITPTF